VEGFVGTIIKIRTNEKDALSVKYQERRKIMKENRNILKRCMLMLIAMIVAGTMVLGTGTDEVSAASKKPYKVTISSCKSYDYNAVKLTWKQAKYAKKYQVYRAPSKYGKYKLIKTTTSRSYINKSLTTGKTYYYKVRAINGSKKGSFSYKKYATPTLKKTYGIKVTANSYNSTTVSWNKVNGAKGYVLYKATSKTGTYKKVKSTTATSYKVTGLTTGKTYYYKVRAYRYVNNKCKYGKYSDVVSKTTALSAPKVSAQLNSENKITVTWNEISGAERYKVYRATSSNGSYTAMKTTELTSYVDNSAKASTKYYYRVKAVRGDYLSSYSNTVNCKWEVDLEAIRTTMLDLINKERKAAGVEPIAMYDPLHYTAQEKAKDLEKTGVFDHYSKNLGYFYDQYDKASISYSGGGENIASGQSNVASVMKSWMNSSGHKANILSKDWTHVGIGYYKGYWVQQFAQNPKGGYGVCVETNVRVECPKCKLINTVTGYNMYSTDAEGRVYGAFYCKGCQAFTEKCSKCNGVYTQVGLTTTTGSISAKCNKCGQPRDKTCVENCYYCNASVIDNTKRQEYKLTLDSTLTYDGKTYNSEDGCYFQQFVIDARVCKSCDSIIFFTSWDSSKYAEFLNELKSTIGEDADIFAKPYIRWEKHIRTELVETQGNTTVYKKIYEFINTPKVDTLDELAGSNPL